ncbi:tat pathway signal sequence [Xylariales sp. PMI_506]|nr:tat pathway signal sequence [Xylariales sp. PMI_506]
MEKDDQKEPLRRGSVDDLDDCESLAPVLDIRQQPSHHLYHLWILIFSIITSGISGAYLGQRFMNLDRTCAAYTTQYSPVLNDVDVKYSRVDFNGSFFHENIYRQPASPEVDAAWNALGANYSSGVISEEDGYKAGLTHWHVRRAKELGGGFVANVEGLHHIHCLNLVRKSVYFNADYYKELGTEEFANPESVLRPHISHCLDALRLTLMCNVDTGMIGQLWIHPDHPKTFPAFYNHHKCKNYDAVRQWSEHRQILGGVYDDFFERPNPWEVFDEAP